MHLAVNRAPPKPRIGYVNGLAIRGLIGILIEIEAVATLVEGKAGSWSPQALWTRKSWAARANSKEKSMARGSVENVATILKRFFS